MGNNMDFSPLFKEINPSTDIVLVGSRRVGICKEDSDWDYMMMHTKENVKSLLENGYVETGNFTYPDMFSVSLFTKGNMQVVTKHPLYWYDLLEFWRIMSRYPKLFEQYVWKSSDKYPKDRETIREFIELWVTKYVPSMKDMYE
jgi:sRNA-binding regulator protein Hfq